MPVPNPKDTTRLDEIELRANEFWQHTSFEDLARQQGVRPVERLEDLLGGLARRRDQRRLRGGSGTLAPDIVLG